MRFLEQADSGRLDALLFSPRNETTQTDGLDADDGCAPDHLHYRTFEFHARDPTVVLDSKTLFHTYVSNLGQKIKMRIEPNLGQTLARPDAQIFGQLLPTYLMAETGGTYDLAFTAVCSLAADMVFPLLMDDLTVSERLVQQFCVAKTVSRCLGSGTKLMIQV